MTELRRLLGLKRAAPEAVLNALEDLREARDAAEGFTESDSVGPVSDLADAVDALDRLAELGLAVSPDAVLQLRDAVGKLQNSLPDTDDLNTFVEAFDATETAAQAADDIREAARGEYTAEERQDARDEMLDELAGLADALDGLIVGSPPILSAPGGTLSVSEGKGRETP